MSEIVDLSNDDYDPEVVRKKNNKKRWGELKKYVPFLEYIAQHDPVKNSNYVRLLHWIKSENEFAAKIAINCESRIRVRYEKLKSTMVFPPHIVAAFTQVDPIVISDEDEDPASVDKVIELDLSDSGDSSNSEQNADKNKVIDSTAIHDKRKAVQKENSIKKCIASLEISDSVSSSSKSKKSAKKKKRNKLSSSTKSKDDPEAIKDAKCDQSKKQNGVDASSPLREESEEGEIISDDGSSKNELELQKSKTSSRTNIPIKTPTKAIESVSSKEIKNKDDDDDFNQKLFDKIDKHVRDTDRNSRDNEFVSWKTLENAEEDVRLKTNPVLRQKNLDEGLYRRKSPNQMLRRSLSPISDEEEPTNAFYKKKKKKHKHKKKTCKNIIGTENNSGKHDEKKKINCGHTATTGDNLKSPTKQKKSSKKRKEKRQNRLLSISDEEEGINSTTTVQSEKLKLPETKLFHRRDSTRKENRIDGENVNNNQDTVVLLDSDDEKEVNSPLAMVSKSGRKFIMSASPPLQDSSSSLKACTPIPTIKPSPIKSSAINAAVAGTSSSLNLAVVTKQKKNIPSSTGTLQDLNNMDLQELNGIYSKLCQATGIQLEELLSDLVTKSTTDIDRVESRNQEAVLNQTESEPNISPNNFNNNNIASNEDDYNYYALQQQQVQAFQQQQGLQQQNQLQHQLEQEQLQQQQQHALQMQYPLNQTHCDLPMPYAYRNSLRPGLNLNDPRIVQKLKQIKDSPIHNVSIRDSATFLMNYYTPRPQNRSNSIVETTSKTATTYGEHKRLRELEKQRALERRKAMETNNRRPKETPQETPKRNENVENDDSSLCTNTENSNKLMKSKLKRKNSSGSESSRKAHRSSGNETSDEEGRTIMSFSVNPSSRKRILSSSSAEEDLPLANCTGTKESSLSGRMTPFEKEKVLNIVFSAIGTSKESASKTLRRLSISSPKSRKNSSRPSTESVGKSPSRSSSKLRQDSNRQSVDSTKSDEKSSKPKNDSVETIHTNTINNNNAKECNNLRKSLESNHSRTGEEKKRGRPKSNKKHAHTSTKNAQQKRGNRELSNLNCTFVEYREMFEKNCLPTIGGKRRCSVAWPMYDPQEDSSDSFNQKFEENLILRNRIDVSNDNDLVKASEKEVRAAPIQRRRQTCSALSRNTLLEKKTLPPLKFTLRRLSESTFGVAETIDNSSDDTDEFVVENHRKSTLNHDPFESQLKIKLRKLSFDEIGKPIKLTDDNLRRYTSDSTVQLSKSIPEVTKTKESTENTESHINKSIISHETPILVPVSSKPVVMPSKTSTKTPRHLNADISMTLYSTKICAICNKRPSDLTNHYVVQHKTESYISRLTASEIETLETNITLAVPCRKRYKISCVFCQDELEDHFVNFYPHYSSHTGEYGFRCDVCEMVKPYREDIRSHQLRTSRCRNGKIRTNYLYSPDLTVIYLFVCKLCNFVQLNEANIHKHHRDHHGYRFDQPQHVKKCIIAALDNGEVANEILSTNPEDLNSKEGEVTSYCDEVIREQEFVHECPLDIKDVLLTIEMEENIIDNETNEIVATEGNQCTPENQSKQENHVVPQQATPSNSAQAVKQEIIPISSDLSSMGYLIKDMNMDNLIISSKAAPSPEALLAQLHAPPPLPSDNIMTVIHYANKAPCQENHQPYVEPEDKKPDIKDIKLEQLEVPKVEPKPSPNKALTSYRQMNSNFDYFGLYKCTLDNCWFSANVAEKFIEHMSVHARINKINYLRCAYCRARNSCAQTLVLHVRSRHSMSLYQCSQCSYRTVEPGNMYIHREVYHKDTTADKRIHKCAGRVRKLEVKVPLMKKNMIENVTSLKCPDCSSTFYALSSIKLHIQTVHPLSFPTLNMKMFNEFACIYCTEQSNSKKNMQVHLATRHPNEMAFVAERTLAIGANEDSVENLNMIHISVPVVPEDIYEVIFEKELNGESSKSEFGDTDMKPQSNESSLPETSKLAASTSIRQDVDQVITKEEQLIIERIKPLLDLITSHLKNQSRHEYICFHCIISFYSREKIADHFALSHQDCPSFTEKAISSAMKCYYIAKKKDVPVLDWASELQNFATAIRINWIKRLQQNTKSEWFEGLASACLEEIELPEYIIIGQPRYKCLVRSCPFIALDENALDHHLNGHIVPRNYKCSHCAINLAMPDWDSIKNHKMLHKNELHICCVCKFIHHRRSAITNHIDNLHNSRDVPVISLWRDETNYKISLTIVLPPARNSFKTSVACFCCRKEMKSSSKFVRHLRTEHNVTLSRKCELCEEILLTQAEVDTHSKEHETEIFKLKYDVLTTYLYNLTIQSMSPFSIEVKSSKEKRCHGGVESSIIKRAKVDEGPPVAIKEEVIIKTECDEDVILDDLNMSGGLIKCVNIDQLVVKEPAKTSSPAQEIPKRPEKGTIHVKLTAELQMAGPTPISINVSQHQHHHGGLPSPGLNAAYFNSPNSLQNLPPYPTGVIQPPPVIQYPPPVLPKQHAPSGQFIMNVPLPNNQGTAVISRPSQSYVGPTTTMLPPVPQTQRYPGYQLPHYAQQNAQATVPTIMAPSTIRAHTSPVTTHSIRTHYAQQNVNVQPAVFTTVMHPNINHQQITTQYIPQPSASANVTSSIRQAQAHPGIDHSKAHFLQYTAQSSLNLDGSQDSVTNRCDPIVPEILPICGNCKKECTNFSHLMTHFKAVHAPKKSRLLFRLERRVECVNCTFSGSLRSLQAHYTTFHPDKPSLCRSVIDSNRCGICHGTFSMPPFANSPLIPRCQCPMYERTLADCLDLKILNTLQNFGEEFYAYLCVLCKRTFHYQGECLQHILSVHKRLDIFPQPWLIKNISYVCNSCDKSAMTIKEIIDHIRNIHISAISPGTLADRMAHYNKIGVIYPMGLIVHISELQNTGSFDAENFKRDIQCVEAQYNGLKS